MVSQTFCEKKALPSTQGSTFKGFPQWSKPPNLLDVTCFPPNIVVVNVLHVVPQTFPIWLKFCPATVPSEEVFFATVTSGFSLKLLLDIGPHLSSWALINLLVNPLQGHSRKKFSIYITLYTRVNSLFILCSHEFVEQFVKFSHYVL